MLRYEKINFNFNACVNSRKFLCLGSDNRDYSFMTFVNGLRTLNIEPFPYEELKTAFSYLDFSNIWEEVGQIWENVDGLISFFQAVGLSFKGVWDSIVQIGQMIYYSITFAIKSFGWLFTNLMDIIKFVINYILNQ